MEMNRCPNCGALLTNYENEKVFKCPYCHSVFGNENHTQPPKEEVKEEPVRYDVNGTYDDSSSRPRLNFVLFIILFACSGILGIIYLLLVMAKQKEWDKKNKR